MTVFYLVQHGEKARQPGDPGLTETGFRHAGRTAALLRGAGLQAVFSSPLRRARQTAEVIASAADLAIAEDVRLRERMNWDGSQPIAEFLTDWAATVGDRSFVPRLGDSSLQAGERFREFLLEHVDRPGPIAVCTHGGVTVDLLRTLLGDQGVPERLWHEGIASCAITTLEDHTVLDIASVSHLTAA